MEKRAEIEERIKALKIERALCKTQADSGKLVINSSFGKFGNKYSALYSPQLLMQVTLTGQLALLMLIERIEATGCRVVSANTDGVTTLVPDALRYRYCAVLNEWEVETGFTLEATEYKGLYSRDVNNYLAIKIDGKEKTTGLFGTRDTLKKNPDFPIIADAVKAFLINGTSIESTIKGCTDIRRFLSCRTVTGGAIWDKGATWEKVQTGEKINKKGQVKPIMENRYRGGGVYLGKVARWYWSTSPGCIRYKKNSNKVPRADNSTPIMDLSTPANDIDYQRYIDAAIELTDNVGYFSDLF